MTTKTTKTTKGIEAKKLYTLAAGNTVVRPGHRHDCAEVTIRWEVWATSKEEAISVSRQYLKAHDTLPGLSIVLGDLTTKLNVTEA